MRVSFNRAENRVGIIVKKIRYAVTVSLELTDAEAAIATKHDLWEYPVAHGEGRNVSDCLRDMVKGRGIYSHYELAYVKHYEHQVMESCEELSEVFKGAASHQTTGNESFEF